MTHSPSIWILTLLFLLPQCSEALYTSSLPDIATSFQATAGDSKLTMTLYLIGFAAGLLSWGFLSDKWGRKPLLITGVTLFLISSVGSYFSPNLYTLFFFRFLLGLGGSAGTLLGQTIVRETSTANESVERFSLIGGCVAFVMIFIPTVGGVVDELLGWRPIFVLLSLFSLLLIGFILRYLPETRDQSTVAEPLPLGFFRDKNVFAHSTILALTNGLAYCIYTEGPFYLKSLFHLTPSQYGYSFLFTSLGGVAGALYAKQLLKQLEPTQILQRGLLALFLTAFGYTLFSNSLAPHLFFLFGLKFSVGMILPASLSQALANYQSRIGTASSLFGSLYYIQMAVLTYVLNYSGLSMPLFFLWTSALGLILYRRVLYRPVLIKST